MKLLLGDCLDRMKELEDNSIDAIVTDPPYGLSFMGKKWDYDVPSQEIWEECLRILKPGGYLLSFAGTRTQHRMAVRIEDAGFEIRDMIAWVYGSGFPKSHNIGKAVDKLQGNEREVVGEYQYPDGKPRNYTEHQTHRNGIYSDIKTDGSPNDRTTTKGTSEWEGWGTALKPALEPITVARKPLEEKTVAKNCLKWGVGGINIDGSRVKPEYNLRGDDLSDIISICQLNHLHLPVNSAEKRRFQEDMTNVIKRLFSVVENVSMSILEKAIGITQESINKTDTLCSEEILAENINTSLNTSGSGKKLTEKSLKDLRYITSTVSKMIIDWKISNLSAYRLIEVLLTKVKKGESTLGVQGRFPANLLHDGSDEVVELFPNESARFFYCAKASKKERNMGCEGLEKKAGGSNAKGYTEDVAKGLDRNRPVPNFHPTVKPIALMEYLVKLVSREGAVVLDPFMGSGTTGMACKKLGREFVGIEMSEDYMKIAKARIDAVKQDEQLGML